MKEKIKKLDKRLTTVLWIVWLVLVVASYFFAVKLTAPKFEIVNPEKAVEYTFETEDGDRVESAYYLAWQHDFLKSPKVVFRDDRYDKTIGVKDEYYQSVVSKIDKSKYSGIIYHAKWIWFGLFFILSSILVAVYGDKLRDRFICNKIKKNPDFLSCTYFLYDGRSESTKKDIKSLIPKVAGSYIDSRKVELQRQFSPALYQLVSIWLETIKYTGSTTIHYGHKFKNELVNQKEYLNRLISYWDRQRGFDPKAEQYIEYDKGLLNKDYVDFPVLNNKRSYTSSITQQLNELFTKIMGSEIFKFDDCRFGEGLTVETTLENNVKYFSWSGSSYSGKEFPGIQIRVKVLNSFGKSGDERDVLWSHVLFPVTTYSVADDDFKVEDLYGNMIVQTLDTLTQELLKK